MQVTKGTWRMHEQCVPGSLSSSHAREPGSEATVQYDKWDKNITVNLSEETSFSEYYVCF